jgi:arabinan endo-1,5-alpha-L-arabinosidase
MNLVEKCKLYTVIRSLCIAALLLMSSCCGNEPDPVIPGQDPYDPLIADNYSNIASRSYSSLWGPYNLHDPTIIKHGDYYYIFSTDVAYGPNGDCGIMWRRSQDLVHWTFLGWVFDGVPPKPLAFMEANQPGYNQLSIWAPFIHKVNDTYRLYSPEITD